MSSSNGDNSGSGQEDQQQGKPSRNLTFRPAIDKPDELMVFLKEVADRYNAQRRSLLVVQESAEAEPVSCSALCAPTSVQVASPRKRSSTGNSSRKRRSSPAPASASASAPAKAKTTKATAPSDPPDSASTTTLATGTASTTGRRKRSRNHASLVGAKNIDIHAPDPEEDSPPDETASERRKRRERINGRRKRAKLMIEIDTLNTRYHELKQNNAKLSGENASLRIRIAEVKRRPTSHRPVQQAPAGPERSAQVREPYTKKTPAKRKKSHSFGTRQQQESKRGETIGTRLALSQPQFLRQEPLYLNIMNFPRNNVLGPTIGATASTSSRQDNVSSSNPLSMQPQFALNASLAYPTSLQQQPFLTVHGQLQYPQAIPNPGNLQQTLASMLSNQQEQASRLHQLQQSHHWLPLLGLGQRGEQQGTSTTATNASSPSPSQDGRQQSRAFSQQEQNDSQQNQHHP